jgi:hypothetical protein
MMRAVEVYHGIHSVSTPFEERVGKGREVTRFLELFMHYGLVAAILVWAGAVGLMAYHLTDSPWRWAFVALSLGGLATVGVILLIRKYINVLNKAPQQESK